MSRQLTSSDQETNEIIKDLEKSYRERMASIDSKAKKDLYAYEKLDETLRKQILSLREEIDLKSSKNSKSILFKKQQLDQSLSSCKNEKERDLTEISKKLQNVKERFFKNNQEYENKKTELLGEKSDTERENLKLRTLIADLGKETEKVQSRLREVYNKDIHYARQEIESLKDSFVSSFSKIRQDHSYELRELEFRAENYDRTLENLLYDIDALKREDDIVKRQTDRDISYLRDSLMDSNKEVETCEEQTIQLLRLRDEAKEDSLILSKVTGELETDLGREMKVNSRLSGKLAKLERLVYGKVARSPSKSRLI